MAHDMTRNMKEMAQDMTQTMTSQKAMKPPVNILNLPPELLDLILSFSASSAWTSLRLTCRHLYTRTLDTFARRFFHEVKTDLSEAHLVRLECLAKNAFFAPYVHCLQIKHSQATPHDKLQHLRLIRLPTGSGDRNLVNPGVPQLHDILQSFPNCSSFHFNVFMQGNGDPQEIEGLMPLTWGMIRIISIMHTLQPPSTELDIQCLFDDRGQDIQYLNGLELLLLVPLESVTVWGNVQHTSIGFASVNRPLQRHVFVDYAIKPRSLVLDAHFRAEGQTLTNWLLCTRPRLHLERLCLTRSHARTRVPIHPDHLRTLLSLHSPTLQELELSWLTGRVGEWIPILKFLAAAEFPELNYVLFKFLGESQAQIVQFPGLAEDPTVDGFPEEKIVVRSYHIPADSVSYRGLKCTLPSKRSQTLRGIDAFLGSICLKHLAARLRVLIEARVVVNGSLIKLIHLL